MIKVLLNTVDVSELINSVCWSGNDEDISRTLELSYLYATEDYYAPKNYPNLADTIYFYYDNVELFRGKIYNISNDGSQGTINITCYDDSIRLGNSTGTFNIKDVPAETITAMVLKEVDIKVGSIAETKINQKKLYDSEKLYTIITESYKNASLQNGKSYINFMLEGSFNVIETNIDLGIVLDDEMNITGVSFSEDATNIINRVKIYDESQQYLDVVENTELINKFGVFQEIYTEEEDKQSLAAAKEMLKGIEQSVSVDCLGNYKCISGYVITVNERKTGLSGKFYISSDSHTWENGQYKMSLDLEFRG